MSKVVRVLSITTFFVVGAVAVVVAGGAPTMAADEPDSRTFSVDGIVSVVDIDPTLPGGQGFVLDDPTGPPWVDAARNENGDLTIRVKPDTEYRVYDPESGTWPRATYEDTIIAGEAIKVGGRQYTFGDHVELFANYVWRPVKPTDSRPANPAAEPKDFLFQRTFNVLGTATQRGVRLGTNDGVFCPSCGFVVGQITEFNNVHVESIAAAHFNKVPIVVNSTTKYYIVQEDGSKRQGSLDDVIVGEELRTAGKYGFADADWRFLASYVWIPDRSNPGGVIEWQTVQNRTADDESGGVYSTSYEGENVAGDSEVFPGRTVLALEWSAVGGSWNVSGTWTASDAGGNGSISGTVVGTWDPATGRLAGQAEILDGTGRHADLSGSGSFDATTAPGSAPPAQIPNLGFDLRATRS